MYSIAFHIDPSGWARREQQTAGSSRIRQRSSWRPVCCASRIKHIERGPLVSDAYDIFYFLSCEGVAGLFAATLHAAL
jgi:hypothetical protein